MMLSDILEYFDTVLFKTDCCPWKEGKRKITHTRKKKTYISAVPGYKTILNQTTGNDRSVQAGQ